MKSAPPLNAKKRVKPLKGNSVRILKDVFAGIFFYILPSKKTFGKKLFDIRIFYCNMRRIES